MFEKSKAETTSEALASAAKLLMSTIEPKIAETEVRVSYFGKGQRFSISHQPENKLRITLYFHEDSTADFGEVCENAARAATPLFYETVLIRKELLRNIYSYAIMNLSREEEAELAFLLRD